MKRSLAAVVDASARELSRAGFAPAESRAEAGLLARSVLGWTEATWLTHQQDEAPPGFETALAPLLARRARREPVAYLIGEREFYGRPFRVTSDVLIPRPETEGVVEVALRWLTARAHETSDRSRVIDVGTGSGCLAVTLACERPSLDLVATDVSAGALALAAENAHRLGVAARIRFRHGSLLAGEPGPWDLVVSNPPYIARPDRESLPPDVREFEPEEALFGGDDGLVVIRRLIAEAARALAPDGALVLEMGAGQADAIRGLLSPAEGWASVTIAPDLQGIPRVACAQRAA